MARATFPLEAGYSPRERWISLPGKAIPQYENDFFHWEKPRSAPVETVLFIGETGLISLFFREREHSAVLILISVAA